jgi:hypothetical protein
MLSRLLWYRRTGTLDREGGRLAFVLFWLSQVFLPTTARSPFTLLRHLSMLTTFRD